MANEETYRRTIRAMLKSAAGHTSRLPDLRTGLQRLIASAATEHGLVMFPLPVDFPNTDEQMLELIQADSAIEIEERADGTCVVRLLPFDEQLRKVLNNLRNTDGFHDLRVEVDMTGSSAVIEVISSGFEGLDEGERQQKVMDCLWSQLSVEEIARIEFVLPNTPEETKR